ncbi:MAG: hypothetical protein F2595_05155 [Actinobacteria bacterium]|nr:hypothetical protein [Actinomycetota bacterium]MSZ96551.1 hypothetical protein [Actinomycetota bacterium]
MSTEEVNRLMLAASATEALGKDAAAVLMDHLPMGGISHLATKDDLVLMRAEFHTDVADLRTELKTEIAELRTEVKTDIAELRAELYKVLNAQTTKFITVMTAINALMFAGLKWG